jgi:hypothetical protein
VTDPSGIVRAVLGFVLAIFGVGLVVGAVFQSMAASSRVLLGLAGIGLLSLSFVVYRSLGSAQRPS